MTKRDLAIEAMLNSRPPNSSSLRTWLPIRSEREIAGAALDAEDDEERGIERTDHQRHNARWAQAYRPRKS